MLEPSIKNTIRATIARFHAALKNHDHPKLAELHSPVFTGTPEGPDVDNTSMKQLVNVKSLMQLLPHQMGNKRNVIRTGRHDGNGNPTFLVYDADYQVDPDNPGTYDQFDHALYFNGTLGVPPTYHVIIDDGPIGGSFWFPSNSASDLEYVTGGIGSSNRLCLKNANGGVTSYNAYGNGTTPVPYANPFGWTTNLWTEHLQWEPDGARGRARNILRTGRKNVTSSPTDCGVFWKVLGTDSSASTEDNLIIYLRTANITFPGGTPTYTVVESRLVIDKLDIPGGRFIDGTKYFLELMFDGTAAPTDQKGYYSFWINGVKVPIYQDNACTTLWNATAGPNQHTAYLGPIYTGTNGAYAESSYPLIKVLGGSAGGSCLGYIEDYVFKHISGPSYSPAANYAAIVTADVEPTYVGTPAGYMGVSQEIKLLSSEDSSFLFTSASNNVDEITKSILEDKTLSGLSLNNICYLYLENDLLAVNPDLALIPKFTVFKPQFGYTFNSTKISGFQCYWDSESSVIKAIDVYGNTWRTDDIGNALHGVFLGYTTDFSGCGTIDTVLPDPILVNPETDWLLVFKNDTSNQSGLWSPIKNLNDTWTIRIGVRRPTSNFGTFYRTRAPGIGDTKGIMLDYTSADSGTLIVSLSYDGITWDAISISDSAIRTLLNTTTAAVIIEVYYTGFKYGIRVGGQATTGSTPAWVYDEELASALTTPLIFESDAVLMLGGLNNTIPNLITYGFQILPYVYKDHISGSNLPSISSLLNVDPEVTYFNKHEMETKNCSGNSSSIGDGPIFLKTAPRVYVGEVQLDKGGIRSGLTYGFNGRYESSWMLVDTTTDTRTLTHGINDSDLSIEVYFNTVPDNTGRWKDSGLTYVSSGHLHGVGVKNITDSQLTLKIGNDSVTNLGSAPTPGTPVTEAYMKVVATRNW